MTHTEQDSVRMIDDGDWPHGHNLPVKHKTRKDETGWPLLAVVRKKPESTKYLLCHGNIYSVSRLSECTIEEYDSADSLVKAGWVVD